MSEESTAKRRDSSPGVDDSRGIAGGAPSRPGQSLNDLGCLLQAQGNYGEAREYLPAGAGDAPGALPQGAVSAGPPRPGHKPEQPGLPCSTPRGTTARRGAITSGRWRCARRSTPRSGIPRATPTWPQPEQPGPPAPGPGNYGEARGYLQRALAMYQALYPKERYPQGHPDLARSLNNLGVLLRAQGDYGEAQGYLQRALEMSQTLYPKERYPQGHPDLATSLNNLGYLLWSQGNYGEARGYLQRALEMNQALYPKERYPQGHPELASA